MITATLIGNMWQPNASLSLAGDAASETPNLMSWTERGGSAPYTFYTEIALEQGVRALGPKVLLIVEPKNLYRLAVSTWRRQLEAFDYVLTYYEQLLAMDNAKPYLLGGSWIAQRDWGLNPKQGQHPISMFVSEKTAAPGHRLRLDIADHYRDFVSLFGRGVNPVQSKLEGLSDYPFHIVVESHRGDFYISEKLIDAMACGCVPIYYGCPSIWLTFNPNGILPFANLSQLSDILKRVHSDPMGLYDEMRPAVLENFEIAERFRCVEDQLVELYPYLFDA